MKISRILPVLAAIWLVSGHAESVFSAEPQLAQGKKDTAKSKGKGAEKAEEMVQEKDERLQGQERAMESGEGEKTGLIRQVEEDAEAKKAKKAKKAK